MLTFLDHFGQILHNKLNFQPKTEQASHLFYSLQFGPNKFITSNLSANFLCLAWIVRIKIGLMSKIFDIATDSVGMHLWRCNRFCQYASIFLWNLGQMVMCKPASSGWLIRQHCVWMLWLCHLTNSFTLGYILPLISFLILIIYVCI